MTWSTRVFYRIILGGWKKACSHAHFLGRSTKQTVTHVRENWYGNEWDIPVVDIHQKCPVDCNKLFLMTSLKYAATKFVPLCEGISGKIGELVVDVNYEEDPIAFLVDESAIDLTTEDGREDEREVR
jgi:hypothetical protein